MADLYPEEMAKMLKITEENVSKLMSVWTETFDQQMCQDNIIKLLEHTKNYYNDLICESMDKKEFIKNAINDLRTEAENLRRLLKTEVHLPRIDESEVPLLVLQKEMDKSLTDLREQLRLRHEQICYLLLEQETLCDELGEPPRPLLADPLPTATELEDFRYYLDKLKDERADRMQQLVVLRKEIKNDLHILEVNVNTEDDDYLLNHRQIKLNNETFQKLRKLRERVAISVADLKMHIDTMRQKLPLLWDRLNTPYQDRRKIEQYSEYCQLTHDILHQELERCEEIKRKNIKSYIQKVRLEIEIWWGTTLKSDVERNRFSIFNSKDYTDELLSLHEMELEDLKRYYEDNHKIFELYASRKTLWERMNSIEQKASDPARYNNRGGQLLKEEKERRTIATKLPKIEQQIHELVQEYQEREHTPFLVYGEDIIKVMQDEWTKKKQDKEAISTARKNALTPRTFGSNRSQLGTPLGQRNISSVLQRTPSVSSLSSSKYSKIGISSQKRKLNPSEKSTPVAKRTLFVSPRGVFLKPTMPSSTSKTGDDKLTKAAQSKKKHQRVIATTIRRSSGRLSASGAIKKRRSIPKNGRVHIRNKSPIPDIRVTDTDEDNYDAFKKRIEPDSRSSIQPDPATILKPYNKTSYNNNSHTEGKTRRQKQQLSDISEDIQDKIRLETLPKPQLIRAASTHNLREYPASPGMGTSSRVCSNRKLTTKNLPIII